MHRAVVFRAVRQRKAVIAFGRHFCRHHVRFRRGPPHSEHLQARIRHRDRFLHCGGVHHAPAPQEYVVGTLLADLQPSCLLLHAGMRDRQLHELKAVFLGMLFQYRDRFLAVGRIVVNQRNLLALQAALFGDVLDQNVGGSPVGSHQREVPREHAAINRFGTAETNRKQRDLVGCHFLGQCKSDAGRQRIDGHRLLAFDAFIAFHASVGRIAGFALVVGDLDAVHATVARIDQLQVIDETIGPRHPVGRIGSGAIYQHWNIDFIAGLCCRRNRHAQAGCHHAGQHRLLHPSFHVSSSCDVELLQSLLHLRSVPAQCGNGHNRNFSLAIAHNRASPCGSAMRKNTISAPNTISSTCEISAVSTVTPNRWPNTGRN